MSLSFENIISKLKNDEGINFVAFAKTPWHAHSVMVSLIKLQKDFNINLKGIIVSITYNKKSLISDNNFFNINNVDYEYFDGEEITFSGSKMENLKERVRQINYCKHRLNGKRKIYVINPLLPNFTFIERVYNSVSDVQIINVICDEGLGTYTKTRFNWMIETSRLYKNPLAKIRSANQELIVNEKNTKNLLKQNELLYFQIFHKNKNNEYIVNNDVVDIYKQIFNEKKCDAYKYSYYSNSVVINTQLYYENNEIKNDADLLLFKFICESLKKQNIQVILKPHPREANINRYESLGCIIEKDNKESQESIFSSLKEKPLCVISFTSTALVTSSLFFGITAISLNKLCKNKTTKSLNQELNNFNDTFKNIINIPKDKEELINKIINLKGNNYDK